MTPGGLPALGPTPWGFPSTVPTGTRDPVSPHPDFPHSLPVSVLMCRGSCPPTSPSCPEPLPAASSLWHSTPPRGPDQPARDRPAAQVCALALRQAAPCPGPEGAVG